MPDSPSVTIVMLGDSLTAGYGLETDEALPSVVERRLRKEGFNVTLVNSGISGDTTGGGLFRFDDSVAAFDPDILVVALGTNDFLMGIPVDIARRNLSAILTRAKNQEMDVVLVGIEPDFNGISDSIQGEYARMLKQMAEDHQLPFHASLMKGVWGQSRFLLPDGLHPTARGVEMMGERLSETLKAALSETES